MEKIIDPKQKLQKEIRGCKWRKISLLCGLMVLLLFFVFFVFVIMSNDHYPRKLIGLSLLISMPGAIAGIGMYRNECKYQKNLEKRTISK